jgi:hypothetical protein
MGLNLTGQLISATYEDLVQISGSILTDGLGNNINNLTVTASLATTAATATSASFATTSISASHAVNSDIAVSASFATNASTATSASFATTSISASHAVNSDTSISASFALTASFAENVTPIDTGSFVTTASISNADITFTKADASTFSITVNNVSNASTASIATSASYAQNASTADSATSASFATNANTATSASHALNADNAISSSYALTASFAENVTPIDTGSFMVTGSATLNTLTFEKADGSTFNLTVDTGSAVTVDTGSLLVTASISDATITFTKGDASTFDITVNNVQNASTASIATSASYALTASFAENVVSIDTGSFYVSSSVTDATITFTQGDGTTEAVTVNNVQNAVSASFATSASFAPSTPAFPFTGSAQITGSLGVTGSVNIVRSGTNAPFLNSSIDGATFSAGEAVIAIATGDANINALAKVSGIFGATNATIGATGFQAVIVGGDEHDVTGIRTGVFGGYNNNITAGNSYIFGGGYNDITGGSGQQVILGGNNINITFGTDVTIVGGLNNTISGGSQNAILAGSGHTNAQNRSVIIGGQNITANAADTVFVPNFNASGSAVITGSVKIVGTSFHINSNNNSGDPGAGVNVANIASGGSTVNASAKNAGIVGGTGNILNSSAFQSFIGGGALNNVNQIRTVAIGGYNNALTCPDGGAFNTQNSILRNGSFGFNSSVLSGESHLIDGGSVQNSAIIAGKSNFINNVPRSVILGGQNITASVADTVYVPNFDVSGSSTFKQSTVFSGSIRGEVNALSIASNTASLDCALDNFFTLQLVSGSDTFINPSNILPGQTINLRINTTGSATVSFPSSVLQQSGSAYVPTTTTGVDVVTFISFDATSLLLSNVKNLV